MPIDLDSGYAIFDHGYLDGEHREALPATTDWKLDYAPRGELIEFYRRAWREIVTELSNTRRFLRDKFHEMARRTGTDLTVREYVLPPAATYVSMAACSGCPPQAPAVTSWKGGAKS